MPFDSFLWPDGCDFLLIPVRCLPPYVQSGLVQHFSSFTGSAGVLVLKSDYTGVLITDSRYTKQAEQQVDPSRFTVTDSLESVELAGVVGADTRALSIAAWSHWKQLIDKKGAALTSVEIAEKTNPTHNWVSADVTNGRSALEKRNLVLSALKTLGGKGAIVTCPEEISWVLNVRSPDRLYVPCCPASILLLAPHETCLFVPHSEMQKASRALKSVEISILSDENTEALQQKMLNVNWVGSHHTCSEHMAMLFRSWGVDVTFGASSLVTAKSIKDTGEIAAMQACHLEEASSLIDILYRLENNEFTSEWAVCQELEKVRQRKHAYWGPSFPTISAFAGNTTIVHYHPTKETSRSLGEGAFLLDAGGQYEYGTTDMTRSVFLGDSVPSAYIDDYTAVLRAHIALAKSVFPKEATAAQLDGIVRKALWAEFRDYKHGTGHGVGFALNVHEAPPTLSGKSSATLKPGMVLSIEPGFYEGNWGIRLENLYLVQEVEGKEYLRFAPLTAVPFQTKHIDFSKLTQDELQWLQGYHGWVLTQMTPLLDKEHLHWVKSAIQHDKWIRSD